MIISADCIDNVDTVNHQTRTRSVYKKKSKSSRSSSTRSKLYKSTEFYTLAKKCNNLLTNNQYINNNNTISWKFLLKQVLNLNYTDTSLPPNIILIGKLDLSTLKERDRYSLICNETDFLAQTKIASENQCSFTILVKYLKNQVFKKENEHKYVNDILKPNSIYISVTIFNSNYCLSNKKNDASLNVPTTEIQQSTKGNIKYDTIKSFVSAIHDNLSNLESYIGLSVAHEKHSDQMHVGFFCNHCKCNIIGIRYRCSVCSNFDLCEVCEIDSDEFHPDSHAFLKIKKPFENCFQPNELDFFKENLIALEDANKLSKTFKYSPEKINFEASSSNMVYGQKDYVDNHNSAKIDNPSVLKAQAGSKITKIWKIRNNGNTTWTSQISLQCVSGNIAPLDGRFVLPVPLLKPSEDGIMTVSFKIPSDIKSTTNFESVWHFYCKECSFGEPLYFNITATPVETTDNSVDTLQLSDSESSDISNDSIKFPACFNLDVPFLNEENLRLFGMESDNLNSDLLKWNDINTSEDVSDVSKETFKLPESQIEKFSRKSADKLKSKPKSMKKVKKLHESQSANKNVDKSSESLIPVPSLSNIKKIAAKNKDKSVESLIPVPNVSNIKKITVTNELNKLELDKIDNQERVSSYSKIKKVNDKTKTESKVLKGNSTKLNSKSSSSKEQKSCPIPQPKAFFPDVNKTISNFYANILSKSGATNFKKQTESSKGSADVNTLNVLKNNALQKLFEMGFCNQTLNMQLLMKNNFDIHETIRELYFSIGNNFFPEKTLKKTKPSFSADDSVD